MIDGYFAREEPGRRLGGRPEGRRQQQLNYYPARAKFLQKEGSADIECRILVTGKVTACAWLSESRPDFGFGDAASRIGCAFKFRPRAFAGPAPQAEVFKSTIRFNLEGGKKPK